MDKVAISQANSDSLLRVESLSVEIESVPLLSDISLSVSPGEVLSVVGPNGAGKSTLLRTIASEQIASKGRVCFHGSCLSEWQPKELATHLAVLPQKSVLEFPFTSREVVSLARTPHDSGKKMDDQIVNEVMSYMDVQHLADRLYTRLSGGEQQRVQLARILAQIWQPVEQDRLLILDEPSSYFDLAHQQMMVKLIREMAGKNVAIIVVLHDLNLAMSCADSMAILCCGRLEAYGAPEAVLTTETIKKVFGVQANFIRDEQTGRQHLALMEEWS